MTRRGYSDLSRLRVEPTVASDYVLPTHKGERVSPAMVFDQDALDMGSSRGLGAVTVWENLTRGTLDSCAIQLPPRNSTLVRPSTWRDP